MNDIVLKIAGQVSSLAVTRLRVQQQINEIPLATLELSIPVESFASHDTQTKSALSSLTIGATVTLGLNNSMLFSGYLTQKRIQLRGKRWRIKLEARHLLQKLAWPPRSRVFRQQSEGDIINGLLRQAGVQVHRQAAASLAGQHEQMVQFRLSDWHFIRRRLLATNCWLVPDAASENVTIGSLAVPVTSAHTLERFSDRSGYSLREVELNTDGRYALDSLTLQGWDATTQQLSAAQRCDASAFQPWREASRAITPSAFQHHYQLALSYLPEAILTTLAQSRLNYQQLANVRGYLLLEGTRDFQPAQSVKLSDFGPGLEGTALLTGVNQLFDVAQGWQTELIIGLAAVGLAEATENALHIATVAEYRADPQNLDRIPVTVPALNLPQETLFARPGKPYASKASGFCFYPEPGDEVVIAFIEGDPRYPVILGALHNPVNSSPLSPAEGSQRKGLVVTNADDVQSLMIDTAKKEIVLSAGENDLTLGNNGTMSLTSTEALNFTAAAVNYQADDKITIAAKNQVEITSASINMKK